MDMNLTILSGRLAAEPEVHTTVHGVRHIKCLITVRSEEPKSRIDVIAVVLWDPDDDTLDELILSGPVRGMGVLVSASIQRRFWSEESNRSSRIEVVASTIFVKHPVQA